MDKGVTITLHKGLQMEDGAVFIRYMRLEEIVRAGAISRERIVPFWREISRL